MAKALILTTDGQRTERELATLEEMQEVVGGNIEVIGLPKSDLYVNEDGVELRLPPNRLATRYAVSELNAVGRRLLLANEDILGTVFILGKPDASGEPTDCP